MRKNKRERLARAGWKVGDAKDFVGLTDVESTMIDARIALARARRAQREGLGVSQTVLATKIGSSQSRVAKMEGGDPSVSIDLLIDRRSFSDRPRRK